MKLDVFDIHDQVLSRYRQYVKSFLSISDERIKREVGARLFEQVALWPEALSWINAGYENSGHRGGAL